MKEICFLLVHISLACKLSTTSSKRDTADEVYLLRIRLILKSFASFAAPGGPIVTKNDIGRRTSAIDVLRLPLPY